MRAFLRFLHSLLTRPAPAPVPPDSFGQSAADDLRFLARRRRCRRTPVVWRAPTREKARRWEEHPIAGRFGDSTYAVTEVDGRLWVVRDRL